MRADWLQAIWWRPAPPPWPLRPLSRLYGLIADHRAAAERVAAQALPVPVIVVGNIAVGGTGKTPVTLALVELLRGLGRKPGVISRGYGGRGPFPLAVSGNSDPARAGDEPVLIAARSGVPLVVAPDRVAAGRALLAAHPEVDVLVCDDGLQHYRLARDLEFCVIDAVRGHGNGWRLPAGPLREPPQRAERCAMRLLNGAALSANPALAGGSPPSLSFALVADQAANLHSGEQRPLASFAGQPVHAVAGIGHPARFFKTLQDAGLQVRPRPFPDHHGFRAGDLQFGDAAPVLMTEKDAVKCRGLAHPQCWAVPVTARFGPDGERRVRQCLQAALESWRPAAAP